MGKILLVAMPWMSSHMPSIQVAALKQYLAQGGISAEAAYWYLDIAHAFGLDTYATFSEDFIIYNESLYSYLLFPEMRNWLLNNKHLSSKARQIRKRGISDRAIIEFSWTQDFFDQFHKFHQKILDRYDWRQYDLVGFTMNFSQNLSSLYMAREIKKRNPSIKVIVGGSDASGQLGASLIQHFKEFDFACNGEGERPLYNLAKALQGDKSLQNFKTIGGLILRCEDGGIQVNPPDQLRSLDELETPSFDEYFDALASYGTLETDIKVDIPIEGSRGCPFSCSFCALNLQWTNFRSRSPEKVAKSMRELCQRYQNFDLVFTDNITPSNAGDMFEAIAAERIDWKFFYELRANTPWKTLETMKRAGVYLVQVGLEALSTSMLKIFNKKARAITNIHCMKMCEELGIKVSSNLIIDHPLATENEVSETIRNMAFCWAYRPPNNIVEFVLEVGAPDYEQSSQRGYEMIHNQKDYKYIYPDHLYKSLDLINKDFYVAWKPADWERIQKPYKEWIKAYESKREKLETEGGHLLMYQDGGTFLRIQDWRFKNEREIYFLDKIERDVYLFAEDVRPWHSIQQQFSEIPEQDLRRILDSFVKAKLMFEEDGFYLSLAMTKNPYRRRQLRLSEGLDELPALRVVGANK